MYNNINIYLFILVVSIQNKVINQETIRHIFVFTIYFIILEDNLHFFM